MEDVSQNFLSALPNEILINILRESDPKDALSLCSTDKRFSELCEDPYLFRILLKSHYSNQIKIDLDQLDPLEYKKYYTSLVAGKTTFYAYNFEENPISDDDLFGGDYDLNKIERLDRDPQPNFFQPDYEISEIIMPGSIPRGSKTWVVVRISETEEEWEILPFANKNEALRHAFDLSIRDIENFKLEALRELQGLFNNYEELYEFAHIDPNYQNYEEFKNKIEDSIILYWYESPAFLNLTINIIMWVEEITLF